MTLNPLLGRDALEPLVEAARARGAGSFVLVRTSNEGAAEIQDETSGARLRCASDSRASSTRSARGINFHSTFYQNWICFSKNLAKSFYY